MSEIRPGAVVKCRPNGNMEHPFIGVIEKCYENSALVTIDEFDPADRMNARELLYRTIISNRAIKVLTPSQTTVVDAMSDVG
ncbi:hypothetical protein [Lacticaseibacillus absianus]|uniref:hypothetical protein n=1 Tax=Lacticaseibacillus absianus TaxID=2729623 RepID=UPI0015CB029D|nr:hypothetical protein [Lacticaseibacillus absianus]